MTALATVIQPLWSLIESYGEDPAEIFESVGIDSAKLREPNARLPVVACNAAWLRASSRIHDPGFGVRYGDYWTPGMFGSLGYAFLASVTLRGALKRATNYIDMLIERGAVEVLDLEDGYTRITLTYRGTAFTLPALADSLLSTVVQLCRISYGDHFVPHEVTLFHSAPKDTSIYFRYFGCPVRFDADSDGLLISSAILDQPLPGRNREIAALVDQEAERVLDQLDRNDLVERVEASVVERLPSGRIVSATIAKELKISNRTLHRQLRSEGTSFSAVLDRARHRLADAYLAENVPITQIAFSLGFSEHTSFTRAYKRWSGLTPSDARAVFHGSDAAGDQ